MVNKDELRRMRVSNETTGDITEGWVHSLSVDPECDLAVILEEDGGTVRIHFKENNNVRHEFKFLDRGEKS